MKRRTTFATRLFLALFLLSAATAVTLLGIATWSLRDYVQLSGESDVWSPVGESGQRLLETIDRAPTDSAVTAAARAHEDELSHSLTLARRFDLIASRLAGLLPWLALVLGLALAAIAAWAARALSLQLSRPVDQMVDWANRLAKEEPLPEQGADDEGMPREFASLRDAFRHMAARLEEGRRQALEAERLRGWTDMARRVAHELKNPLTPLGLALRQARAAQESGAPDVLAKNLDIIAGEAARLDDIARSFAQLGRLPEGAMSDIDLAELLDGLLESDVPKAVTGVVRGAAPRIQGHLTALTRVFRNLLGNAVEAVADRDDGRIEVTLSAANGAVEVAISDNGPGVPAENVDRVWDPDFSTGKRGTGLGLALVRSTVRAHGGDVELRDAERGACFVVRLPLGEE